MKGKTVSVERHGRDRHGRVLGTVKVEERDAGARIVADGLAWHYTGFSNDAGLAIGGRDVLAAVFGR